MRPTKMTKVVTKKFSPITNKSRSTGYVLSPQEKAVAQKQGQLEAMKLKLKIPSNIRVTSGPSTSTLTDKKKPTPQVKGTDTFNLKPAYGVKKPNYGGKGWGP